MAFRVNTWLSAIFCVGTALGALPQGPEPDPVACPHFPSRMHALVWRNWDLVPTARIASVLGTDAPTVEALAADLGLEPAAGPFFGQRMALTIIRRNWHLLDYPQLLALLDWNAAQLADCLIEDDFLWIKLGRLKPRCEPLRYRPPTDEERAHAAWFRAIVRAEKERVGSEPGEPRFAFLEKLSAPFAAAPRPAREESFSIRFIYSYFAVFGDPLLDTSLDPYPDGYLARLAALGVNGVWLHVVLRHLAPGVLFPEEAARAAARLKNLRTLAQRTRRHGIGLYLYFNEPRAQPEAFFASHAELKGITAHGFSTLCTSTPEVRTFLRDGAARVFAAAPELAGFFTITGSENLTSCWSHQGGAACPRCNPRGPQEVVAEVSRLLAEGAWSSQPAAEAIVWDWGWPSHWVDGIVTRLPARCRLMSVCLASRGGGGT